MLIAVLLVRVAREKGTTRSSLIYNEINCTFIYIYIYIYIYDRLRRASFLPRSRFLKAMMMMRSSGTHKAYITHERRKNMERNVDEEFTESLLDGELSDPMRDGLPTKRRRLPARVICASRSRRAGSQNASDPYVLSEQKKNHLANVLCIVFLAQMDIERNFATRRTTAKQSHALQSKRVGLEICRKRGPDDARDYLGKATATEAQGRSTKRHTKSWKCNRVRINGAERQVIVIP